MANFHSYLYNVVDVYDRYGSFTWTKPSDIDDTKPILVHVWGAGGSGSDTYTGGASSQNASGGGGGFFGGLFGGGASTEPERATPVNVPKVRRGKENLVSS